ncbi:hypothetical protein M8332_00385 [Fructilactobacillus ixorae]|uniref:Uncharacterized protein n=1 Tax=Fructilactobacillus ixorae TaxID=1750535 RepID=A0ABY5C7S3_9LACO|nr:hypothetical protein [Fructilactobacillus ixorae]USS93361.1 hypothetical protein M8332_00385 [Fructilactobacillus ixorae]
MRNHEPTYRSVSVGMVTIAIQSDGGQIIAKVIGNNVIAIDEQLNRATVTGPDRAGRYAIGDFVYFITDKRNRHTAVTVKTVAHHLGD